MFKCYFRQQWFRQTEFDAKRWGNDLVRYGENGINISTSTFGVKFYHKGPEFKKHDAVWLRKKGVGEKPLATLQEMANRLLRVEVTVKPKKLLYDFKHVPQVAEMMDEYMERLYEQTLEKVFSEQTLDGRPLARSAQTAKERLYEIYGEQYGDNLLGTWLKLACLGEVQVKETYKPSRYYEHMKKLKRGRLFMAVWRLVEETILRNPRSYMTLGFSEI